MSKFESKDHEFISRCIELSQKSLDSGGAPFGALIVKEGEVIADSVNNAQNKISDHAEILVLDEAHRKLGTKNLFSCTLYSNCEPCPMCSFMTREYHVGRVVFAIPSLFMGGFSRWKILQDNDLSKLGGFFGEPPEVVYGVLENEAMEVFGKFPLFDKIFGSESDLMSESFDAEDMGEMQKL